MRKRLALPVLTALALAACASTETGDTAAAPEGRDCFNADNVSGYTYIDNQHVGISVGANRKYILTTMFNARDLDWTQAIALRSTSSWVCTGNGLDLQLHTRGPLHQTFAITNVARAPKKCRWKHWRRRCTENALASWKTNARV